MRVAVISDVHGNLHALDAALAALESEGADRIWCLGDVVGYGPEPNACCARVRERADACLVGNHDLGVLGVLDLGDFSHDAAESARWTRSVLDADSREWLASLEPSARMNDAEAELYHASPRDPVWEYVLDHEAMAAGLAYTSAPVVLVGHSHVPIAAGLRDGRLTGSHAPEGTAVDLSTGRWLLNPGSVGQPRDGDPRAAYLVLDLGAGFARFARAAYSIEATQREIRAHGLPEPLAARLEYGL